MDWFFAFMSGVYNTFGLIMVLILVISYAVSVYLKWKLGRIAQGLMDSYNQCCSAAENNNPGELQSGAEDLQENLEEAMKLLKELAKKDD